MMSKNGTVTETTQLRAMPTTLVTAQAARLLFCYPSSSLDGRGMVFGTSGVRQTSCIMLRFGLTAGVHGEPYRLETPCRAWHEESLIPKGLHLAVLAQSLSQRSPLTAILNVHRSTRCCCKEERTQSTTLSVGNAPLLAWGHEMKHQVGPHIEIDLQVTGNL